MALNLRPARTEDVPQLVELRRHMFEDMGVHVQSSWEGRPSSGSEARWTRPRSVSSLSPTARGFSPVAWV